MNYVESFKTLRKLVNAPEDFSEYGDLSLHKYDFESDFFTLLPGNHAYRCEEHETEFKEIFTYYNDVGTIRDDIHQDDFSIEENRQFKYFVLKPKGIEKAKKVTFLFHGFNEKNWDKYLPWGQYICEKTQTAVVYFPIAFHMQRAPSYWSNVRKMFSLCETRKEKFPNIIKSTLSNVAISMRLQSMPQRFIWSGLQTYYDIIQFIEEAKSGKHPIIDPEFTFDMFAFSIGGLLAEILKLSNHKNYFTDSKVGLFCSGAVFNRLSPVSKFILDSEANVALYSYLVEHFDSFLSKDMRLRHYITDKHFEGKVFHSMMEFQKMRDFREELFKKYEDQIYSISLKRDTVIPSFEVINTLNGAFRDIRIPVEVMDFDYDYIHENPFPINHKNQDKVDAAFEKVFEKVTDFLNS